MNWLEPRFIITLLLIALFGFAYINDPADETLKGALIGGFSAAYGFWIGSKQSEKAAENTGKAFDIIREAAVLHEPEKPPQKVEVVNPPSDPVNTTDNTDELPSYAR